jgi:LAO/AO transport system kinase
MGRDEETILLRIRQGDTRALARAISHVENGVGNYGQLLAKGPASAVKVICVTGPPGAGKSTLVDAMIGEFVGGGKKVAVLCIDPSSAFHHGALLGDRIRMSDWYNDPRVFIRSLASRGALGGLNPRIIEIIDLVRSASFDLLLIETVGVGQNEIEIAALADAVLVVLAPEAGDDIQSMKSGLLEIADIFVVNKSDRPDADLFVRNLRMMQAPAFRSEGREAPVLKTVASQKQGIAELAERTLRQLQDEPVAGRRWRLLAEQAWLLIQEKRMRGVDKKALAEKIEALSRGGEFNLYRFVEEWK